MKACVCVNGELLEPIPVESRVKQGGILTPTLFAIFLLL